MPALSGIYNNQEAGGDSMARKYQKIPIKLYVQESPEGQAALRKRVAAAHAKMAWDQIQATQSPDAEKAAMVKELASFHAAG